VRRTERIKLFATYLNIAAGSCLTLGTITPLVAVFYITVPFGISVRLAQISAGVATWLAVSILLHWFAQLALGSLHDD
jgi:hypothetical protein